MLSLRSYRSQLCLAQWTFSLDLGPASSLQAGCYCWASSAPFSVVGLFPVLQRILPCACLLVLVLVSPSLAEQLTYDALGDAPGRKNMSEISSFFTSVILRYWETERATCVFSCLDFEVLLWYGMTFLPVCLFSDSL